MNVWIFNNHAVAPAMRGSTRHFDCGLRLIAKGWDVTIFAGTSEKKASADIAATGGNPVRVQMVDGVRFVWIDTPSYSANDLRRAFSMVSFALRARRFAVGGSRHLESVPRPHVIVGSSVHPFAALAAQRVAKRLGVPFVLELRDLWPQSLIEMGAISRWHPLAIGLRALESWLVRRAVRIIVLSERAAEYLVRRGTSEDTIALIPNGVDLDRFGPASPVPADDPPFTFIYLGAHGIANRLSAILDAAERLKKRGVDDLAIVFVGGGKTKAGLRRRAKETGLDFVSFRPGVAKTKVPDTLARADALILTEANNVYGSSNKLSDYLAAGRPIVFSTFAHHNIASDCGIIADPEDPEALPKAIEELARAPREQRQKMGTAGRRAVEETRSWDRLALRYEEVLADAARHS